MVPAVLFDANKMHAPEFENSREWAEPYEAVAPQVPAQSSEFRGLRGICWIVVIRPLVREPRPQLRAPTTKSVAILRRSIVENIDFAKLLQAASTI